MSSVTDISELKTKVTLPKTIGNDNNTKSGYSDTNSKSALYHAYKKQNKLNKSNNNFLILNTIPTAFSFESDDPDLLSLDYATNITAD